jgi:surface protein
MNDSDYNSVNKVITQLPTRTSDSVGTLNIVGIDDISQVDITTAESKFWNVENRIKVVEYKFTNSSDLIPVFNEGFVYTYEDIVDGTMTTKTIYSTELPTKISFNGATRLLEVLYLDSSNITDASNMFYGCTKLTNIVGIKDWDVRKVTTMYMMFTSCTSLTELDLSNWEPSSLITMYGMFYKCSKITSIKLGKGNTPVLTSTEGMFNSCLELLNIDFGGLNVSNVNNMGGMFSDCRKLKSLNISHWDVSKVTNFGAIFRRCNSLLELNLSNWNLSSAENVSTMFESCASIVSLDLSNLVVENVRTLSGLFQSCSSLVTLNLSGWHLEKDVSITNLFNKCDKLMFVIMERSDAFTVNKFITSLPIRSEKNKGHINIKDVDDFVDVNIEEAISKYWTVFRNQGCITNIRAGYESIVNKLLHDKKIKNIYLGNSKML